MAWLAVDSGTSVIKAVVFAEDGRQIAVARRRTTILHPQAGWAEQSMEEVWSAAAAAIREAIASTSLGIRAMAITAQGDGSWLVDMSGRPSGHAILWNDARAATCLEISRDAGAVDAAFRISGSVAYAGLLSAVA